MAQIGNSKLCSGLVGLDLLGHSSHNGGGEIMTMKCQFHWIFLRVEETGVPWENYRLTVNKWGNSVIQQLN